MSEKKILDSHMEYNFNSEEFKVRIICPSCNSNTVFSVAMHYLRLNEKDLIDTCNSCKKSLAFRVKPKVEVKCQVLDWS